jgi:hypothetical protein
MRRYFGGGVKLGFGGAWLVMGERVVSIWDYLVEL